MTDIDVCCGTGRLEAGSASADGTAMGPGTGSVVSVDETLDASCSKNITYNHFDT